MYWTHRNTTFKLLVQPILFTLYIFFTHKSIHWCQPSSYSMDYNILITITRPRTLIIYIFVGGHVTWLDRKPKSFIPKLAAFGQYGFCLMLRSDGFRFYKICISIRLTKPTALFLQINVGSCCFLEIIINKKIPCFVFNLER